AAFAASWAGQIWRSTLGGDWKPHPIDAHYGIETSRRLSRLEIRSGSVKLDKSSSGYVGMQPSVLRKSLDLLPIKPGTVFLDLGCGKGRALAVATEYPFARIIGVEISPVLCGAARANARRIASRFPDKVVPEIIEGDASQFALPPCPALVIYLYHSFARGLVEQLMEHLARIHRAHPQMKMFLIYYNPVHFDLLDASQVFTRLSARRTDFDAEECAVSPMGNIFDSVIIYQSRGADMLAPLPGADASVRITIPGLAADVEKRESEQ
ncbi:MAG TPA: class I SAM-dependent methyltransferase, partial [Rhizomicrobium sp.]|nr:class I SAM-dependent methyltransferase [Rhizomicrobium sp.]